MTEHDKNKAQGKPEHGPHVLPLMTYFKVFTALIVLTGITVGVSLADLGTASIAVAVIIALIKSSLVALIFMHLWWDNKFHALVFVGSLVFLVIFFVITLIDMKTRGAVLPVQDNLVIEQEQAAAK